MKYTEVLKANKELLDSMSGDRFQIEILSNIIVNPLKEFLEWELRSQGLNAHVSFGNYDNIVQDSTKVNSNVALIFWEAANFVDGLEYRLDSLSQRDYESLESRILGEIELVLSNLKSNQLVILNRFSSLVFNAGKIERNRFDMLVDRLNDFVESLNLSNVKLFEIDRIMALVGISGTIDLRNYYSSKSMYTVQFYQEYASKLKHMILPVSGKIKKALILDCDNTLWEGILGEDGLNGISMGATQAKGKPFESIQYRAKYLSERGVLIGLCSKNNAGDVEEVLKKHDQMILSDDDITIKKVNWNDKATNIREIADTLNIGPDSFVFVDDSDFEIGLINAELSEVRTIQVPEKNHQYSVVFDEVENWFYRLSHSKEDQKKTEMYKQQAEREASKDSFGNIQDYLKSLEIEISVFKNDVEIIPRMSQMTQKTNQFNVTTKRYSESDIEDMVNRDDVNIYALAVKDKYGDSGITGLAIISSTEDKAHIDSFLMSCRIIGRGIEDMFMNLIIENIDQGQITAKYVRTKKNDQVSQLFERYGFQVNAENESMKEYRITKSDFKPNEVNHIKLNNGK